jgi:alcohol oxidase
VVVSAGSLGSPAILERSGIGGKQVLEGVGVKQLVDLPGVGENYHGALSDGVRFLDEFAQGSWKCVDHNIMYTSYIAADEAETLDAIYRSDEDTIAGELTRLLNRDFT